MTEEERTKDSDKMAAMYESGLALMEIAKSFDITHEAIRQRIIRHKGREWWHKAKKENHLPSDKRIEAFRRRRLSAYLKELVKTEGLWHWNYAACLDCGTTERPFYAHGRCSRCNFKFIYHNNPGRKEQVCEANADWRKKNPDKVKKIAAKAAKNWYQNNKEKAKAYRKRYYEGFKGTAVYPLLKDRSNLTSRIKYYNNIDNYKKRDELCTQRKELNKKIAKKRKELAS